MSNCQVRRISITSYWLASALENAGWLAWLRTMRSKAASIAATPLESFHVTDSTDPSARTATVTTGWVCGNCASSRTVSAGVFIWILRAQASAYSTSSALGSLRPQNLIRRWLLTEGGRRVAKPPHRVHPYRGSVVAWL